MTERANHLLIIIDELDRCSPLFAVKLLERVKHYFDCDKITFLFAANLCELSHTVKHFYGNEFDSSGYLDRFFDLTLELPEIDKSYFYDYLNENNSSMAIDKVCIDVIKYFNFSLREITRFFTILKSVAYNKTHNQNEDLHDPEEKANKFVLIIYLPVLIGLRMRNQNRYRQFIEGQDGRILQEIFSDADFSELSYFKWLDKSMSNNFSLTVDDKTLLLERLMDSYTILFKKDFEKGRYRECIGEIVFTKRTKDYLLRVLGGFSYFADFSWS